MEVLNKVAEFLALPNDSIYGSGSIYDSGDGSGDGFGSGHGYGNGSGSGYGYGHCNGAGFGYGSGTDFGNGTGTGFGYGSGSGTGHNNGTRDDVKSFAGQAVHMIDGIPTIIHHVHGNIAKGVILNRNLTTTPCYIVKSGDLFAHGGTLRKAQEALLEKQFEDMGEDERIEAFLNEIDLEKRYPTSVFFDWHHYLTGSCEMGRKAFVAEHEIDLEHGTMTAMEFIELTKDAYGGSVIQHLAERIS